MCCQGFERTIKLDKAPIPICWKCINIIVSKNISGSRELASYYMSGCKLDLSIKSWEDAKLRCPNLIEGGDVMQKELNREKTALLASHEVTYVCKENNRVFNELRIRCFSEQEALAVAEDMNMPVWWVEIRNR